MKAATLRMRIEVKMTNLKLIGIRRLLKKFTPITSEAIGYGATREDFSGQTPCRPIARNPEL
jgi:hypothetical protein